MFLYLTITIVKRNFQMEISTYFSNPGRHSTQEICPNMGENQRDSLFEKIPGKGINEIKGAACIQYTSQ